MGMKLATDVSELTAYIGQQGGRASKAVNDQLDIAAQEIAVEIRLRMPVEFGNLEDSLTVEGNRRKEWVIYVDESRPSEDGGSVGDYAAWLNESDWVPGRLSQEKGGQVGNKFMERGFDAAVDNGIIDDVNNAMTEAFQG